MRKKRAVLFVLIAGTLWGLLGVTVRVLSAFGLTAAQIVVGRFAAAALVLCLYLAATDRKKLRLRREDLKYFLALGFFCILFYNICYTVTVQLTSLSIAVALLYTSPIWAMLLSIPVFHEKLTKRKCFSIALCFFGCALMSGVFSPEGRQVVPLGILTGLLAGVGYGSYGIFAKVLVGKYHSLTVTFYTFFLAALGGLFLCRPGDMAVTLGREPTALLYLLLAGTVCFVIPYILYNLALQEIEASKAAVIAAIEPVMASVFGLLLYQERITLTVFGGMSCVLAAIFVLNGGKKESPPPSGDGTESRPLPPTDAQRPPA